VARARRLAPPRDPATDGFGGPFGGRVRRRGAPAQGDPSQPRGHLPRADRCRCRGARRGGRGQ
jgi:hypothetical protein